MLESYPFFHSEIRVIVLVTRFSLVLPSASESQARFNNVTQVSLEECSAMTLITTAEDMQLLGSLIRNHSRYLTGTMQAFNEQITRNIKRKSVPGHLRVTLLGFRHFFPSHRTTSTR